MKSCKYCSYYKTECDGTEQDYNERARSIDFFDYDCFKPKEIIILKKKGC